jgi:hypothetical protein
MAASTNWLPAYNARVLHDGTYLQCTTAKLNCALSEFSTDNTEGGPFHEEGVDIVTTGITATIPVSAENVDTLPKIGALVECAWEERVGGDAKEGWGRVKTLSPSGGGKGGYTYEISIGFTGEVTNVVDPAFYTAPPTS